MSEWEKLGEKSTDLWLAFHIQRLLQYQNSDVASLGVFSYSYSS